MRKPLPTPDEAQRQQELDDYDIAGTSPGPVLEELVKLAAIIGGTEQAAITLIDRDRQWLLARHNVEEQETTREESVCAHAIHESSFFEVPDLHADERFAGNPALAAIRFYGGSQLTTPRGHNIGMLCVMDPVVRRLDERQRAALAQLARTVIVLLERRRIAQPLEWLGRVIDAVADEIFIADTQSFRYLHANASALRHLGYTLDEIRRLTPMHLTLTLTVGEFQGYIDQLRAGAGQVTYEGTRRRSDGGTYPVEIRWQLLRTGGREMVVSLVHDISERKAVDRMKDEFIAVVNHELRTPLTSIHGAVKLLEQGAAGALPPPAARLVSLASLNTDRLRRIVDDILDMERLATGQLPFDLQSVDAASAVAQLVQAHEPAAGMAGVKLRPQVPPGLRVRADPQRLQQVLANLVSNAIKFSPRGAEVEIAAAAQDGRVRFCVTDTGPGVPGHFRGRIFQRFAQAAMDNTRQAAGSGLGLSIVKEMVEKMGGEAGYESKPGRTVFHITLPGADA